MTNKNGNNQVYSTIIVQGTIFAVTQVTVKAEPGT